MYLSVRGDPPTFRLPSDLLDHEARTRLARCLTHYEVGGAFA